MQNSDFVLGSANFGMSYGMSNQAKELNLLEICKILEVASQSGIKFIDSANSYGNAEKKLGKVGVDNFEIITKISNIETLHSPSKCLTALDNSIKNLNTNKPLYGVLVHFDDNYNKYDWKKISSSFNALKKAGLSKNIGISIYGPEYLYEICSQIDLDIIQAPFNVFDHRIKKAKSKIKKELFNGQVFYRSIFLQGILLRKFSSLPKYFSKWELYFQEWERLQFHYGRSAMELALNYVSNYVSNEKVILGVQSAKQLKDILDFNCGDRIHYPSIFANLNYELSLIDPYRWKVE